MLKQRASLNVREIAAISGCFTDFACSNEKYEKYNRSQLTGLNYYLRSIYTSTK